MAGWGRSEWLAPGEEPPLRWSRPEASRPPRRPPLCTRWAASTAEDDDQDRDTHAGVRCIRGYVTLRHRPDTVPTLIFALCRCTPSLQSTLRSAGRQSDSALSEDLGCALAKLLLGVDCNLSAIFSRTACLAKPKEVGDYVLHRALSDFPRGQVLATSAKSLPTQLEIC